MDDIENHFKKYNSKLTIDGVELEPGDKIIFSKSTQPVQNVYRITKYYLASPITKEMIENDPYQFSKIMIYLDSDNVDKFLLDCCKYSQTIIKHNREICIRDDIDLTDQSYLLIVLLQKLGCKVLITKEEGINDD